MDQGKKKNNKRSEALQKEEAVRLVREKLRRIYGEDPPSQKLVKEEPSAKEEIKEVKKIATEHREMSKHQQYMNNLSKSGLSLAEIQTAWHKYYQKLSSAEKHEVWNEFYSEHQRRREQAKKHASSRAATPKKEQTSKSQPKIQDLGNSQAQPKPAFKPKKPNKPARTSSIKKSVLKRVSTRAKKSNKKTHLHSLAFGLTTGLLTMLILLFSFFNERFITPFIKPSHNVSATPIIVDPNQTENIGSEPKIIIPKINIEAPVVFDEPSIEENAVQKALERGVVHYGISPNPGENGNSVIAGHSSGNILNSGEYKFAFLLLKSLEKDDTFFVHKDGKRYVYKVYNKFITTPDDISVLDPPKDRKAITTLITCDPPGLDTNRLIIQAEQIFPDPADNKKKSPSNKAADTEPAQLPSNSPSLWSRLTDWL